MNGKVVAHQGEILVPVKSMAKVSLVSERPGLVFRGFLCILNY